MKMRLPKKRWQKNAVITLIVFAVTTSVLLSASYFLRGYIREEVIPAYFTLRFQHKIQSTLEDENKALHYPLETVGIRIDEKYTADCDMSAAKGVRVSLDCRAWIRGSRTIHSAQDDARLSQQFAIIDKRLKANGWHGGPEGGDFAGDYRYAKEPNGLFCDLSFYRVGDNEETLVGDLDCHTHDVRFIGDPYSYY